MSAGTGGGAPPRTGSAFDVRRVTPADLEGTRAIRLEMLTDSPDAYLETAADFAARPRADLAAALAERAGGDRVAQFVARAADAAGGPFAGIATAGFVDAPADTVGVYGVYVTPAHRGTGVLAALMRAVEDWAGGRGATLLQLEVITGNDRALRAYRRLGFTPLELLPHPTKPGETELRLRRPVPAR
ncbi:hypothetical protein GCM10010124_22720 [Pilimelia terevasa]|uniref:N-acetyltransferase domain-containing protein n=1 Tax=Pilimelia terevasa TaxID=53372 RepID=A0A8J3BPR7_9ACTN|nr:GNAT family N-acetyltransferase [Pilimelia terevasa]GGK29451.1 hypothetical protein GCM10010124_22720 [Pilimelia terevasa]